MYRYAVIIDDSPLERFIAERLIKNAAFAERVSSFENAADALAFMSSTDEEHFPDFILVDIQMPLMSGFDFLDEYQRLPCSKKDKCTVAMLSSTLADEDFARMKKYPVIRKFYAKPLSERSFAEPIA